MMGDARVTRRRLLRGAGVAGASVLGGVTIHAVAGASQWTEVTSPTSKTLYDVSRTVEGPYAAGGSGTVIRRTSVGWILVLTDGVGGDNKTLYGTGVTADDDRLWMVGDSGRIGEYDVTANTLVDHSKPNGLSSTLTDVAVVGSVGDERIYATMGSGKVLRGVRASDGTIDWTVVDTGGSYTLQAVDFHDHQHGRVVSSGSGVYDTADGGDTWTEISPTQAASPFYTVLSFPDHVYVGADNARIWRRDCQCALWTPHQAGSKGVRALTERDGTFLGAGESGRIFEQTADNEWVAHETPTGHALLGVSLGQPDIAVGKSGTILER